MVCWWPEFVTIRLAGTAAISERTTVTFQSPTAIGRCQFRASLPPSSSVPAPKTCRRAARVMRTSSDGQLFINSMTSSSTSGKLNVYATSVNYVSSGGVPTKSVSEGANVSKRTRARKHRASSRPPRSPGSRWYLHEYDASVKFDESSESISEFPGRMPIYVERHSMRCDEVAVDRPWLTATLVDHSVSSSSSPYN